VPPLVFHPRSLAAGSEIKNTVRDFNLQNDFLQRIRFVVFDLYFVSKFLNMHVNNTMIYKTTGFVGTFDDGKE